MFNVNRHAELTPEYIMNAFLMGSFSYFLFKLLLSLMYKPVTEEPEDGLKVSVVMPCYNESAETVRECIESILAQDYPVYEILFIDDGSKDLSAYKEVLKLKSKLEEHKLMAGESYVYLPSTSHYPKVKVHRFDRNRGKRQALAWGIEHAKGDFVFLMDSDGYIFPDTVRELLKPFRDPKVNAVVGHINARNAYKNFMTKLQDVFYDAAFRVGRAAQSVTNCVIVCSGALSMYRKDAIRPHLELLTNETFLGAPCVNGDDRRLTYIALKSGKTKYQETAHCLTNVPESLWKFFKQQVRWNRSFYRWIKALPLAAKNPFIALWVIGEGIIWLFFGASIFASIATINKTGLTIFFIYSLAYLVLASFSKNVFYLLKHPFIFLLSPLFAVVRTILLYPIRLVALLTIRDGNWGTR